jgi:hypothetical protein
MLMQNKITAKMITTELDIDLTPVVARVQSEGEDAQMKRKALWEVIVRMHYLSHELCDPEIESGVSREFTRFVSALLSEWATMAEQAAGASAQGGVPPNLRMDHH